ncbi:MAG: tetratricopeptide repeat protein [Spirochaetales bacterium]|nr:tetratricopeptide repeat protein [Spirochaetales bacterium]
MAKRLFIFLFIINISVIGIHAQSNVFTLYQEGQAAVFNEDYVLAIEKFKQALEINPNYIEPILQLAKLYYETGNYDYSYDYMQRALKLSDKKPELQVFAADIESKLGRYESAEKRYRQVLSKNPLNTDAHNGLAQLYLDTNRHILAEKALLDIIKTDNKNYRAISMLAQFYEKTDLNAARN